MNYCNDLLQPLNLDSSLPIDELVAYLLTTNNTEVDNYDRQATNLMVPMLEMMDSKLLHVRISSLPFLSVMIFRIQYIRFNGGAEILPALYADEVDFGASFYYLTLDRLSHLTIISNRDRDM